jgi:signal transduction histidine kinase
MFLHIFLAFPTGRVTIRRERTLVAAAYLTAFGLQLVKIIFGSDPDSVFVLLASPAIGNLVENIQLGTMSALLLTGAVMLFLPRRRIRHGAGRPAALVVDAFGMALVMLAVLFVADIGRWSVTGTLQLITFAALGLAPVAFLFALLDARLSRGAVAGLVIELRDDPTLDLQSALGRALRDPSLRLAYWLPEFASWTDQDGEPIPEPTRGRQDAVRVILLGQQPIAALTFDAALEEEPELIDAVAAAAGIALENGRLRAELHAQLQELKRSRIRVLEAGRRERQRLERNLHDGAQQRLVALSLELGILGAAVPTSDRLHGRLLAAKRQVSASLEELRDVARGIYPAVLAGHGLPVAVESLTARATVPVRTEVDLPDRLPEPVEVAAYYVISEALTNLDKHGHATKATVRIHRDRSDAVVEVSDDGIGGADPSAGSGLRGMADRVEALGGHVDVTSRAAAGTRIRVTIPCR